MTTPFRALDALVETTPPLLRGRSPYWRPAPPACTGDVREPAWSWRRPAPLGHLVDPDEPVHVLDANGAYLAAASTVEVAHGRLVRTGRRSFDRRRPGYWLVKVHEWQVPDIWSPLGTARYPDRAWLTTPTVQLLAQLAEDGWYPEVHVYDSWTGEPCRLRAWADYIAGCRRLALLAGDRDRYDAVKLGYSQAVTTLQLDKKSPAWRPDWSNHIRTQHAANLWRKAWSCRSYGHPVLGSGTVDEMTLPARSLAAFEAAVQAYQRAPVRIDPTGVTLGTFKIKRTMTGEEWTRG
jgi:hypothetical protein